MTIARRMGIVLGVILATAVAAQAQVMNQVPASAMVVLHVKNLQDFSQKLGTLTAEVGLADRAPESADLLGFVTKQLKIQQGFKQDGEMAVAFCGMAPNPNGGGMAPRVLALIPASDYQALVANYPDAKTDGAVSTVTLPSGDTIYISKCGDYAACSDNKDVVTAQPGGLVITPAAAKELDAKDACVLVNMPAVRGMVLPLIIAGRESALAQVMTGINRANMTKYAGVIKVAYNQAVDFAQHLITDCDDVTWGVNLAQEGIASSLVVDFKPDSHYGQMVAASSSTDQPLLDGLPGGNYLFLMGAKADPKTASQLISELLDPVLAEAQNMGDDGATVVEYLQAFKDLATAQTSATIGVVAPDGELGAAPLIQSIAIRRGDAKAMAAVTQKLMASTPDMIKSMNAKAGPAVVMPMQITFTPAAKTVDGVVFDQFHEGLDPNAVAGNPQFAIMSQIMTFALSQDGLNIYTGVVNDGTLLQLSGLSDDKISAAIAAAKSDEDVLSKLPGIQSTASHLPTQRQAVVYVPVDTLVNTIFTYVGKFGINMGITMPATDPIGMTAGVDGSAVRFDSYVPTQLLTGAGDIVKKLQGGAAPAVRRLPVQTPRLRAVFDDKGDQSEHGEGRWGIPR